MLQFKRFLILIYLHLIISICLIYMQTMVVFKLDFIKEIWLKALIGVICMMGIYSVIGLLWGRVAHDKKKLLLPLVIYMLIISSMFVFGLTGNQHWIIFLNGNIPFTYFIRNLPIRDWSILVTYGLSCILPGWSLYRSFQLSYRFIHRHAKVSTQD